MSRENKQSYDEMIAKIKANRSDEDAAASARYFGRRCGFTFNRIARDIQKARESK